MTNRHVSLDKIDSVSIGVGGRRISSRGTGVTEDGTVNATIIRRCRISSLRSGRNDTDP